MLTNEQLQGVVDYLEGTCNTLEYYLEDKYGVELHELSDAELNYIDDRTMCCESCGWWVPTFEMDDEGNCEDCQE